MKITLPDRVAASHDALFVLEVEFPSPASGSETVAVKTAGPVQALDLRGSGAGGAYQVQAGLQGLHIPLRVTEAVSEDTPASVTVEWTKADGETVTSDHAVTLEPASRAVPSGSGAKLGLVALLLVALAAIGIWLVPRLFDGKALIDVVGMDAREAREVLEGAGYEVRETTLEVDRQSQDRMVIRTDPASGHKVSEGSVIEIQVGAFSIEVRDVTGMRREEAVAALAAAGLQAMARMADAEVEGDIGRVIEQSPAGGQRVKSGALVELTVGRKPRGDGPLPIPGVPSGDAPSGDTPTGDEPAGDEPGGDAPTGDMPSGDRPSGDLPSGDAPSGDEPTGDTPSGDTPTGDQPSDDAPIGDPPSGDEPGGDAPSGDQPTGDTPSGDRPTGDTPAGDTPSGDAPSGDAPAGDTPGGDTPSGDVPSGDTPSGDTPAGDPPTTPPPEAKRGEVVVPDLIGVERMLAHTRLKAVGLRCRIEIEKTRSAQAGTVVSQDPEPGAGARPGSRVIVYVAEPPAEALVSVPDVVGQLEADAASMLETAGFTVFVRTVAGPGSQSGKVLEQRPAAGQQMAMGATIQIVVCR